ncbi:hypothetical protein KI387_016123, partial [Taxus chinensis]
GAYANGYSYSKNLISAVVVKPGKSNSGPDHLSRIESGEDAQAIEDIMPNAQLYTLQCTPSELEDIF